MERQEYLTKPLTQNRIMIWNTYSYASNSSVKTQASKDTTAAR